MTNYYRGWKHSSHNSYFQNFVRRSKNRPTKKTGIKKILGAIFLALWAVLRWIFSAKKMWKRLILTGLALAIIAFIFTGLLFAYYSYNLPDPNKLLDTRSLAESTKIYDRNGKQLYEIYGEAKRTLVKLDEIPKFVREATIAIEDKNFYKHSGFSFTGIIRAAIVNLLHGSKSQGGSTITQQFIRTALLSREKTFARKFKEIALSIQLERKYKKEEILQLYLNEISYGGNAYGIFAASKTYFGKEPKDLALPEAAYLAAMLKAPTHYSPYGPNKEELDARADTVLQLMYEQGYLTKEQRNQAQNQKVEFRTIGRGILAPHFVLYVQDLLAKKYGEISLQEDGLKVTTTLDYNLQALAEEITSKHLLANEKKYDISNVSLVALDPKTGQILAMVGSRDYFDKEHDGAVNVALRPRQPGSSFKPYVYATAFKKGMSPATLLFDVTTNFGEYGGKEYIPQDYDGKNRGPVSVRQALQGSLNIPAVKTLILTGIEDSIQTAENFGITTLKDRSRFGPSLVLGGAEVKLLEHTAAYGVFANQGIKHETTAILKVEDKTGRILEEYRPAQGKEVLDPQIAYQINNVLSDNGSRVFIFGQNNKLFLPDRPAAAKTGTTQEFRDAWTLGYTPSLVCGIWMGNNDNSSMGGGASGSLVPASVWNEFMRRALEGKPAEEFPRPEGITEIVVDSLSGKLPTVHTPVTKTEIFASFNVPSQTDNVHLPFTINGQLKVFSILHSEKPDDPAWEEPVRAWALANGYSYPYGSESPSPNPPTTDMEIKLAVPEKITALPWKITVEALGKEQIAAIELFLDNDFLGSAFGNFLEYEGTAPRVDGRHLLTAQIHTANNKITTKSAWLVFELGQKVLLLKPVDNEEVNFPVNLLLETSIDAEENEVKFIRRSASGKEATIKGLITKQMVGQISRFTLNWAETEKPSKGSYILYGKAGTQKSNQVVIKIP